MPLKSYRGYNTGNTIKRYITDKYKFDKVGADGLFVVNSNRFKLQVDDLEFDSTVHYSLKKKRRWQLREYIRHRLDEEDGPFAADRVELVEGKDVGCNRPNTHYMIHKSAGDGARVRELHRKRGSINRRAVSRAMDEENEPAGTRHVTFDIMQPSSNRSEFVRNPPRQFWNRFSHARQPVDVAAPLDESDIMDDTRLQFLLDELEDELDLGSAEVSCPPLHNLVDFVIPKTEKIARKTRRSRTKSDSSDEDRPSFKDRKIVEATEDENDTSSSVNASGETWMELQTTRVLNLNDSLEMIPERMQFHSELLRRRNLLQQFGERYLEGDSTPRKFAISIGEEIGKDFTVYLVFEEVNAGLEYSVFDVLLNANVSPTFGTLHLFETNPFDQEVITDMSKFIDVCINRVRQDLQPSLVTRSLPIVVSYKKRPLPLVDEAAHTRSVDTLREPDNPGWSKAIFNRQNSRPAASDDWELIPDENFQLVDPVCGICYEALESDVSFRSLEGTGLHLLPSCTLNACDHQFCHDCWRKHLVAGIRQGLSELQCPENDCKEVVDVVTVIRFVSLSVHSQHATLVETAQVERDPAAVWCPGPRCGRAVRLEHQTKKSIRLPLNVHCECGTSFCFVCREEAHWPAHCRAYKVYKAKLQLLGDLGFVLGKESSLTVKGQHCPQCNLFMEKNGGCNSMICRCGVNFCWHCGQLVSEHDRRMPCFRNSNTTRKKLNDYEFQGPVFPPSASRSKHYCNTVKWRALRLKANKRNSSNMYLSRPAIRELLFKSKKKQGDLGVEAGMFQAIDQETARIVSNYEEILRIVEFLHVAAMSLVKTQMETVNVIRNIAQNLARLAAGIRDAIMSQRQFIGSRYDALQKYFAEVRECVHAIHGLGALRNPKLQRKTL